MSPATLSEAGFRFTYRKGSGWNWRQDVEGDDFDATDLTDEEFEKAVKERAS